MKNLMKMVINERGFTLIELLIAIPITAAIVAAASGATIQIIQSTDASAHMNAVRQVQTSGHWVSHDAIQAQQISVPELPGFPFTLTWTDWDDSEVHQVRYSLQDMPSGDLKQLNRQETAGPGVTNMLVAQYIDLSQSSCVWNEEEAILYFNITASVTGARGEQIETRTYGVIPRSLFSIEEE